MTIKTVVTPWVYPSFIRLKKYANYIVTYCATTKQLQNQLSYSSE